MRIAGQKGFSYLELVVATAIVALLAAVAIPSYMTAVRKNNRTDAFTALARIASAQELLFNNQAPPRSYTDDFSVLEIDSVSQNNHYDLSIAACAGSTLAQCYVATATAKETSSQHKDTGCTSLTLDSRGNRSSSPNMTGCWRE